MRPGKGKTGRIKPINTEQDVHLQKKKKGNSVCLQIGSFSSRSAFFMIIFWNDCDKIEIGADRIVEIRH